MPSIRSFRVMFVASIALLLPSFGGCSPNKEATEKCKTQLGGAGDCANCCKANGAAGHKYVSGTTCECLN